VTPENGTRQAIEDIREQVRRLDREKASAEALAYTVEDVREIKLALQSIERTISGRLQSIEKTITDRAQQRVTEREAAARERKLDRRWMVWAIFTATGLVIAAMAILLPTLNGGGV
jgi:hypothetical protein